VIAEFSSEIILAARVSSRWKSSAKSSAILSVLDPTSWIMKRANASLSEISSYLAASSRAFIMTGVLLSASLPSNGETAMDEVNGATGIGGGSAEAAGKFLCPIIFLRILRKMVGTLS
jgi:hypothetical protein